MTKSSHRTPVFWVAVLTTILCANFNHSIAKGTNSWYLPIPLGIADDPVCLLGDHFGVPESDALTAANLVCSELRKQGIAVGDPVFDPQGAAEVYRVVLTRLGGRIQIRLVHERPAGTVIFEQDMWLANIEEVIPAAARLAEAVVRQTGVPNPDVESVVEEDVPHTRKVPMEKMRSFGIQGVVAGGLGLTGAGITLGYFRQGPRFGVGSEFRVAYSYSDSGDFISTEVTIGGRYIPNLNNTSPYLGSGLVLILSSNYFDGGTFYHLPGTPGFGLFLAVGAQTMRVFSGGLGIELRVSLPFASHKAGGFDRRSGSRESSRYIAPISLALTYNR